MEYLQKQLDAAQKKLNAEMENKAAAVAERDAQVAKLESEREALLKTAEENARVQREIELRVSESNTALERLQKQMDAVQSNDTHALLGTPIADLGYKRVHLVTAKTLETIPVWK